MRVLLVEDREADAAQISGLLRQHGHEVDVTENGEDALGRFVRHRPDLVITSVFVPGIDGIALTEAILRCAAPHWQPVIFVANASDEVLQTRAMEVGGDAFFVKPVPVAGFVARVAVVGRLLRTQEEAAARLAQLTRYLAAEEEDLRIASHLISYQMAGDGTSRPDDLALQSWRQSCSRLSGDLLLVSRTPNGVLHVMLADARSSGLAAYVSLLPIIAPFYRMTEKGFSLTAIVRELNLKVRHGLPADHAVTAQVVAVDTREGVVSVWNGGMPTACMLDGFGHHFQEFPLKHEPLGALDDASFDDRTEQHAFERGEQLVMVSDGLLESVSPSGKRFGEQGLADALVGLSRRQRRAEVIAALDAHLGGQAADDDMTLVLIDCEQEPPAPLVPPPQPLRAYPPGNWRFSLCLSSNELRHLDVVPLLLNMADQFHTTRGRTGELFVILSELFNNALDHGVLRLDSRVKHSLDGLETWLLLREERLGQLESGEIALTLEQEVTAGCPRLRICCRDSGPGYDARASLRRLREPVPQATPSLLPSGRGLMLLNEIADGIDFNEAGNEVTVVLALEGDILPLPH